MTCKQSIVMIAAAVFAAAAWGQDSRPLVDRSAEKWACCSDPSLLPAGDPARGEVPMPGAAAGWAAFHLFTTDTWRLHCIGAGRFTDFSGSPQVLVFDEKGRTVVLQSDSGKWLPKVVVEDGHACSGWAHGDLDPAAPGAELYVGGGAGNLWQLVHRGRAGWESRLVASAPGATLSKLVLGDFVPSRPGDEMLAFTNSGAVYDVAPPAGDDGKFAMTLIGELGSRVRDAVLVPVGSGRAPRVAALMQTGEVALVTRTPTGFAREALCREPMSIARLARKKPDGPGSAEVVYVARVDGLILRFAEEPDGTWAREIIYAGPQGPRGLTAGRFDADPKTETVAVFGYSKKVQILSRRPGEAWTVETVYTDPGGGHWLTAAELDGRNTTDELVGGGFSYHVFMVARQAGYGLAGVPGDPDVSPAARRSEAEAAAPPAPARRE